MYGLEKRRNHLLSKMAVSICREVIQIINILCCRCSYFPLVCVYIFCCFSVTVWHYKIPIVPGSKLIKNAGPHYMGKTIINVFIEK